MIPVIKKALIVSNSSGLVSDFLKNDIQLLKEKGYEIHCACNTDYPGKNTEDFFCKNSIKVYFIPFPIRNLDIKLITLSFVELKKVMNINEFSVIHCHSTIAAIIARQLAKNKRRDGVKVIFTTHGFPFYEGTNKKAAVFYKKIERYYSRFTDAIVTICNEDYENAKQMYCKYVYKINGVGVDISKFELNDFDKNSYRKSLGFHDNQKIVLSIGELNTNKNHRIIIEALSKIGDKNIVYAICGREVTEKGKQEELTDLAKKSNVNLKFLGYRADISEICHCADIGAIPSYKEGLGLSGIEMLASGIPVVGSNRQGIKDYIINGENGFLCEPDSIDSFADGIRKAFKLLENKNVSDKCKKVARHFDIKNSKEAMKKIYNALEL